MYKNRFSFRKIWYSNTLLKIFSVIIAVILWAYIIIVIDAPTDRVFRDVTINTVNEQVLSENGYSIERLSVQIASVKIKGSRKLIAKFDSENINATLDFSEINEARLASEGVVTVNLKVSSEFGEIVSFTPSVVDVYVEPTKYKDIDVRFISSGHLSDGFVTGDTHLSQSKVRIFGAQKNIDDVSYAALNYDLINTKFEDYSRGMISETSSVVLYNNDRPITEKEGRWIWNNSPEISFECPIYKTVRAVVVPRTADFSGASLKCTPSEIVVYGDNDRIDEYTQIETAAIYSSQMQDGSDTTVKLNLPQWMKVVDNISEVVVNANSDK